MRRRLRLLLRVTLALLAIAVLTVVAGATLALRSEAGRAWTTARVEHALRASLAPDVALGLHGLRLTPLGQLRLDSLSLRDASGTEVLRLDGLRVDFSLRALLDRELHLSQVTVERGSLDLVQDATGRWNVAALAAADTSAAEAPSARAAPPWRLRLDSLDWRDGRIRVTRPDSLPTLPPRRDELRDLRIALGASAFTSDGPEGSLRIARLEGKSATPDLAIALRDADVRVSADSAALGGAALTFGRSESALRGSVNWSDSTRDARVNLRVEATQVDLADIAWADPLVPKEGRATATLRVLNGASDGMLRTVVERFTLDAFDSHLEGRLIAETGDSIVIRDVDVRAEPLDFALLHALFGDSSPPPPWDGRLRGQLRAPGGPLRDFALAASTVEFEDRRVGGARSRVTIDGRVDLEAVQTTFQPLHVRLDSVDVRSAGAVTDVADSLSGYLSGRVTLEGPLDDFRFRDLDLLHVDGAYPRSRVLGSGRIAEDTTRTWLEASLELDTVSLAPLRPAISSEPLRGILRGRLETSIRGDSVAIEVALEGEGATLAFTGATSLDESRLVALGRLRLRDLDAGRFLAARSLPAHAISGTIDLGLDGAWEEPSGPLAFTLDSSSQILGMPLRQAYGQLALEPGGLRVDSLQLALDAGTFSAKGRLARDPTLRDTLRFVATLDSVPALAPLFSDTLAKILGDSLGGHLRLEGIALGSLDTVAVAATLSGDSLRVRDIGVASMRGELLLDGVPRATQGLATFDLRDASVGASKLHQLSAEATVRSPTWVDASFRAIALDTLYTQGRADVHYMGDSLEVLLDSLTVTSRDADWRLARPSRLFRSPARVDVDSLLLLSRDGARFALSARLDSAGPLALKATALRVPLRHARFTGMIPPRIDGLLTADAELGGTLADPRLTSTWRLDSTRVEGREAPELRLQATYASQRADLQLDTRMLQRDAIALTAELPVDLSFDAVSLEERLLERPLYVRLSASGTPLAGFEALVPELRELQGGLDADIQVTGTWRNIEPRGIVLVRDGAFSVPTLNTGFRDFLMDVSLAPDSIVIQRARLVDERSEDDSATVEGAIVRSDSGWRADLRTSARNLRVIDDPRSAEADVSWQLTMRGPLAALGIAGDVTVPQANIFIGRQRRRALALEEDLAAEEAASEFSPRLEGIRLRLGNEVRLRSPEASVQLTGEVAAAGTLDEPDVRGEIQATRGTFRLDLGLLQRTFQVDSGRVRLNGPLSNPPTMDIQTSYIVRQADREDVKIGARLSGTVDAPRLTLSSGDLGTTASETEIISYLLFGAPSFVLDGQSASAVRLATAALVPSLGGAAERALGARLPFLSELQVVTVAGDSPRDFTLNSFEGLLNSFALTAGTQIGPDSYLRLSGGVCRGDNRAAQSLPAWFGIAGEYRPRERLSAELSLTPGSAPCNRIGSFAQIYQVGLDLYKDWRW